MSRGPFLRTRTHYNALHSRFVHCRLHEYACKLTTPNMLPCSSVKCAVPAFLCSCCCYAVVLLRCCVVVLLRCCAARHCASRRLCFAAMILPRGYDSRAFLPNDVSCTSSPASISARVNTVPASPPPAFVRIRSIGTAACASQAELRFRAAEGTATLLLDLRYSKLSRGTARRQGHTSAGRHGKSEGQGTHWQR